MTDDPVRAGTSTEAMSLEHVTSLWDTFRSGGVVICPKDESSMAASIDSTVGAYRLVCVKCGHATPWFESRPGIGVRLRRTTSRPPPNDDDR